MNTYDQQDFIVNVMRIEALLKSGIFEHFENGNVLQQSAFIELMIRLRDLMSKAEKHGKRIDFSDDLTVTKNLKDISDAIKHMRDACCHIDSFKRIFDSNESRGEFILLHGKTSGMKIGNQILNSEYDDDVAIYYGINKLYFKRHILRAYEEAKNQLQKLMQ